MNGMNYAKIDQNFRKISYFVKNCPEKYLKFLFKYHFIKENTKKKL